MTEIDSTCVCQVCGTLYLPTLNKDGSRRKTKHSICKSRSCRDVIRPPRRTTPLNPFPAKRCTYEECLHHAVAKGFCSKHYHRLRAHGDAGVTLKPRERTQKFCGWCGESMLVRSSIAHLRSSCSRACANHIKARDAGYEHRITTIVCAGCHSQVVRSVRKDRDSGKFCGRACAFETLARIADERSALRRIGERMRRSRMTPLVVAKEIAQLRQVARNVKTRIKQCRVCGSSHVRRAAHVSTCSRACEALHLAEKAIKKKVYKNSDAGRAIRRRAKAKRRAAMRGAEHESIDPIKVFERDKWRCHLCGIKTPRKLRGTIDDRAPELEHLVSLADGGSHTWGNVACSCRRCNHKKGSASFGQLGLGFAA